MRKTIFAIFLFGSGVFAQNDTTAIKTVGFNSEFTYKMLDQNQDPRKVNILLKEKSNGGIKNNSLIIGTSLISLFDYQHSDMDSKFSYLMRHPTASNQIGHDVSEVVIHSFQLSLTATVNSWLSTHAEMLYNPAQSFGSGTITSLGRNQISLAKGFVLIGNLDKFPVYAALGKMDAPFGQMGSVSPFTNTSMWHAFAGIGYGGQVGFEKYGLHAKFMAVQGGAQFRAMHTPVGDGTAVPSKINNYVADLNYSFNILSKLSIMLGGSYLHGSAYCQDFPVTHFSSCQENNPAYTYYGKLLFNDKLTIKGGFAKTTKVWKATHNPNPPLDVFPAVKVSSFDLGAKYDLNQSDKMKYTISGEFSNFLCGAEGSPWERQNQIVVGFASLINKSSKLFLEVFRTEGYVPLNFISGSNPNEPFPAGETHSIRDAYSIGIVVGAHVSF